MVAGVLDGDLRLRMAHMSCKAALMLRLQALLMVQL